MKPHTAISAIKEPLLRQRLEQQGVVFTEPDIVEVSEFLSKVRVTRASHAIAHISILDEKHRKELKGIRKINPTICIIIIAYPRTRKDKMLMDIFAEFNVHIVIDGSHNFVESIVKIIEETAEDAVSGVLPDTFADTTIEQPIVPYVVADPPPSVTKPRQTVKLPDVRLPKVKAMQTSPPPPAEALQTITEPVVQVPEPLPKQEPRFAKQKKARLPKPIAPMIIPIFGGSRGTGCTWLTLQIGYYIAQQDYAVAVCGSTDLLLMGPRYVRAGDKYFTVKGVDVYPYLNPSDLLRDVGGYDYIVFDVGLVVEFGPDGAPLPLTATPSDMHEIRRSPCPIMVTDVGLWRQSALMLMLTNSVWQDLKQKVYFAASCRASQSAVNALERQYQISIARLPVAEPFDLTAEVTQAVELLLQPLYK